MSRLKMLVSPAGLCLWAIFACIGFSVAGSSASRVITVRQETRAGFARASFPVQMKRWDEPLFDVLMTRAKADMAEFLKNADLADAARPSQGEDAAPWQPHSQSITYLEQFRSFGLVSYLEVISVAQADALPAVSFRAVNFDKVAGHELTLADILEGASDQSKPLQVLADYARSDLSDQTGEDETGQEFIELTKPDLAVYERFTFCPSTKSGKAAGLTIHFPPAQSGLYAGSDFHITVPFTVFSKFLKPGLKVLFSGEPRQTPVSLQDLDS